MNTEITMPRAVSVLENNLSSIGRVYEWADQMGYECPKKFSRYFLRHYNIRPQKVIDYIRLVSIINHLRRKDKFSNHEIAQKHSIPDEKALNNFTNYHTMLSPSELKTMPVNELELMVENLGSKFRKCEFQRKCLFFK